MISSNVIKSTVFAVASLFITSIVIGAEFKAHEYESLLEEANTKGVVSVMITLDDTMSLADMKDDLSLIKESMALKAEVLFADLGDSVLKTGYWNNHIGQIGVYLNVDGLRILANTDRAVSFSPDVTRAYRIQAYGADGSLDEIEATINKKGFANVEVFLNVDTVSYGIGKGKNNDKFKALSGFKEQTEERINNIHAQKFAKGFDNLEINKSGSTPKPSFKIKIDRVAFYGLRESADVRAIRPVNFVDSRKTRWSKKAMSAADDHGDADVIITLRGGAMFSPKMGLMSEIAKNIQINANRHAFDNILSDIGMTLPATIEENSLSIGVVQMRLSSKALTKLYNNTDPRILDVQLNRSGTSLTLQNSIPLINMPAAWNAGFSGAGQNIVVIDSGIRKDHLLFSNVSGGSKVTFEACFGTSGTVTSTGTVFNTSCPSPNGNGDSPLGLLNSGEPSTNLAACNALGASGCPHGSHVSGIAAGSSLTNFPGVAIDANLISINTLSIGTNTDGSFTSSIFDSDIMGALQAIVNNTTPGTNNNPFVVNMSLGDIGRATSINCDGLVPSVTNAINDLNSRGIPVVIATGNDFLKNSITWPACISQAIKVSAVHNDTNGTTLADFSNIGNPSNYTGPILMAPGGGGGTVVVSATNTSTTGLIGVSGTSQATPHVTGIYAVVKAAVPGISVADATAWIVTSGSINVTFNLPAPVGIQNFRRIAIPNF